MIVEIAIILLSLLGLAWFVVLWPALLMSGRMADQENQAAAELIGRNSKHGPD